MTRLKAFYNWILKNVTVAHAKVNACVDINYYNYATHNYTHPNNNTYTVKFV